MPHPRTIAALLALSALLFAGWTGATHWHFSAGHFSAGHFSEVGSRQGCVRQNCPGGDCSASPAASARMSSGEPVGEVCRSSGTGCEDEGTAPGEVPGSAVPHCELCDFLAGNDYAPVLSFEFAGTADVVELLAEPSVLIPVREWRSASCRGPPLFV